MLYILRMEMKMKKFFIVFVAMTVGLYAILLFFKEIDNKGVKVKGIVIPLHNEVEIECR